MSLPFIDPSRPNALVACEESAETRTRLEAMGFNAWSCDLLPSRMPGKHYQGDVFDILYLGWDLLISHPPCTYLSSSGLHWNNNPMSPRYGGKQTEEALQFVGKLLDAPIRFKALENPRGCIGTRIRPYDQTVQPWEFGDDASKTTDFWLENLPPLVKDPAKFVAPRIVNGKKRWANQTDSGQNKLGPSEDRAKIRSKTYGGIADAMAQTWGGYVLHQLAFDLIHP
jgi:hypothetical protein